jgi:hypothetical protein
MAEKLIYREKWEGKSWWLSSFYVIRQLQADIVEKRVV